MFVSLNPIPLPQTNLCDRNRSSHPDNFIFSKIAPFCVVFQEVFTEQLFLQEGLFVRGTDYNFPGSVLSACRTDNNFSGRYIFSSNRCQFSGTNFYGYRTGTLFPGRFICSWNRLQFSKGRPFCSSNR